MKLLKFVWILAFGSMSLFASTSFLGKVVDDELEVMYSYYQDNWIMGLSDGSCWQLMPLKEKRKQSWTEWWKNNEPKEWELTDEFFFDPVNWMGKYKISVHEANDSIATGYSFILVNEQNQQKIFAQFIAHGADLIPKIEYAKTIIDRGDTEPSRILNKYHFVDDILVLDDKTSWKLNLLSENARSFSQWWNGEEIDQPDPSFVSTMQDWSPFDEILVHHAAFENKDLLAKYKVSKREQEVYLVENMTTNKLAYASSVAYKNLLEMLSEHAKNQRKLGYNRGYSDGYSVGKRDGESDGYQKGYRDGRSDATPITAP